MEPDSANGQQSPPQRNRPGPKTPAEKLLQLERQNQVKGLWVRGIPQYQIARDLGISVGTVNNDLKAVRKLIAAAIADELGKERILAEVAKLDACEAEAWAEWERSKRDAEVRQAKTVKTPAGRDAAGKPVFDERQEASKREEGQCGDPRFLTEIRACVKQRCELLGLIVEKHEHTGADGAPIAFSCDPAPGILARARAFLAGEGANGDRLPGAVAGNPGAGPAVVPAAGPANNGV
jgi:hypothetical protein